jgi:murein DD-endopeptidase MepM/ murein hydrolase activator NlpD
MSRGLALLAAVFAATLTQSLAAALDLVLPTANDALYRGDGPEFYQHIERDYQGAKSTPWEGGQYGFVRDPMETSSGLIYTRFHEGIDIRPLHRDERGEPTDVVHAIAPGKVVHVNPVPGWSNYGRYIVIEHQFGGCAYYSLYGHLSEARVSVGQTVGKGDAIAVMGHTGAGINLERSHVHLELNLLLSHRFQKWYDKHVKNEPNHHGIYNGMNLAGLNVAKLYLALQKNPGLTIPQFLSREEAYFKVLVPNSRGFELVRNYPWMLQGETHESPSSWEVSFDRSGLPLAVALSNQRVKEPQLSFIKASAIDYRYLTRDMITGRNGHGSFTKYGRNLIELLSVR